MKKLFALLFCLVMIVSMVGCAADEAETTAAPETEAPTTEAPLSELPETEEPETDGTAANGDDMSLVEILDGIYEGYNEEMPMLATMEATDAESFTNMTFATYKDGYEAASSEPMMTSIAHAVVLVRVPDEADVEAVRAEMEEKYDPYLKWLCVEPEKSAVIANGNTIMLVMTTADLADVVIANFNALWA